MLFVVRCDVIPHKWLVLFVGTLKQDNIYFYKLLDSIKSKVFFREIFVLHLWYFFTLFRSLQVCKSFQTFFIFVLGKNVLFSVCCSMLSWPVLFSWNIFPLLFPYHKNVRWVLFWPKKRFQACLSALHHFKHLWCSHIPILSQSNNRPLSLCYSLINTDSILWKHLHSSVMQLSEWEPNY